jgi:hypothetical protein
VADTLNLSGKKTTETEAAGAKISNKNALARTLPAKTDRAITIDLLSLFRVAVTIVEAEACKNAVVSKECAAEVAETCQCVDADAETTLSLSEEELSAAVVMENSEETSVEDTMRTTTLIAITKTRPDVVVKNTERCGRLPTIMYEASKNNKIVRLARAL